MPDGAPRLCRKGIQFYRGKYFGTDGFRGEANVTLTAEQAFRLEKKFLSDPV